MKAKLTLSMARATMSKREALAIPEIKAQYLASIHMPEWVDFKEQECTIGNHSWAVAKLISCAKDLPIMDVPLRHLNVWLKYKNLTMREFVMHMRAILAADLAYPIILDEDGELMDGRHRIMRCMLEGIETIKAVRFDKNPIPDKISEDLK